MKVSGNQRKYIYIPSCRAKKMETKNCFSLIHIIPKNIKKYKRYLQILTLLILPGKLEMCFLWYQIWQLCPNLNYFLSLSFCVHKDED